MTNTHEGRYIIKPNSGEASSADAETAVRELIDRVEAVSPNVQGIVRPDGLSVSTLAEADHILADPRLNREGELFLDMDPLQANISP